MSVNNKDVDKEQVLACNFVKHISYELWDVRIRLIERAVSRQSRRAILTANESRCQAREIVAIR